MYGCMYAYVCFVIWMRQSTEWEERTGETRTIDKICIFLWSVRKRVFINSFHWLHARNKGSFHCRNEPFETATSQIRRWLCASQLYRTAGVSFLLVCNCYLRSCLFTHRPVSQRICHPPAFSHVVDLAFEAFADLLSVCYTLISAIAQKKHVENLRHFCFLY